MTAAVLLSAWFGVALGVLMLVAVWVHSGHVGRITLLDWTLLTIGGVYGFGWVVVVLVSHLNGSPGLGHWIVTSEPTYALHAAGVLLLAGGITLGWTALGMGRRNRAAACSQRADAHAYRLWSLSAWVLLAIGIAAHAAFTSAYGGPLAYQDFARAVRAGFRPVENPLSFLRPIAGTVLVAAFGFVGLVMTKRRDVTNLAGLVLSVATSLVVLNAWGGRFGLFVFLTTLLAGWVLSRNKSQRGGLGLAAIAFSSLLVGSYTISSLLGVKAADNLLQFMARELAFPFASFFAQYSAGQHLARAFVDLLAAPAFLLPSSIWSSWLDGVSAINTALLLGAAKGQDGVTAGIPVDLITLGLMQANILGVPLVGFGYGVVLRALQRAVDNLSLPGVRNALGTYVALQVAVRGVAYAQPELAIPANIHLVITAIVVGAVRVLLLSRPARGTQRDSSSLRVEP